MDAEALNLPDVHKAQWCFQACECGLTRHVVGVMHSDKSIEVFPMVLTGPIDEEEWDEEYED